MGDVVPAYLLVGGDSEIGDATRRRMAAAGLSVLSTTRRDDRLGPGRVRLDLLEPPQRWSLPAGIRSAAIFAAVARIAACHDDPEGSALVNVDRTLALAERLVEAGSHVLHLSTNQVFDGTRPALPADAALSPVSAYGRQKARTETALLARIAEGAPIAILRLAKVVSPGMALLRQWREELAAGRPVRAFSDMTMAPVPVDLVARAIAMLMEDRATGIFQLAGPKDVAYSAVAGYIADRVGADPSLVTVTTAAEAGMPPGSTPRYTTLDASLMAERYGLAVPPPFEVIDQALAG